MPLPSGERGIADVITAWRVLHADDADMAAIARILGFGLRARAEPVDPVDPVRSRPAGSAARPEGQPLPPRSPGLAPPPPRPPAGTAPRTGAGPARPVLSPVHFEIRMPVGAAVRGGLEPERTTAPATAGVHPHRSLFVERLTPSLVGAMVATDAGDGRLDIERLVRHLAARDFPRQLPVLPRPSLFRGVQLLVDVGTAMVPFRRDAAVLADLVTVVVGRASVDRQYFADSPLNGIGPGARWTWNERYVPPAPGTPVLVVTDLGIGGPLGNTARSTPEEWAALVDVLGRRGSPLVALVPYPRSRWPGELVGRLPIVAWDRRTSLTHVRRAVGRVLGGPRD